MSKTKTRKGAKVSRKAKRAPRATTRKRTTRKAVTTPTTQVAAPVQSTSLQELLSTPNLGQRSNGAEGIALYRRGRNIQKYLSGANQDLINRTFGLLASVVPNYAFGQAVAAAKTGVVNDTTVANFAKAVDSHYHGAFPRIS